MTKGDYVITSQVIYSVKLQNAVIESLLNSHDK